MNLWLNENFYDNRKIKRLIYELGSDAIPCLHKLWFYAQKYAVDNLLEDDRIGILKDFDDTDIEMIVSWSGDKGVFVKVLNSLKLIEKRYSQYFIHDFLDNNPQIAVLIAQKKNGSKYAKKRWDRKQIGDPIGDPLDAPKSDLMQTEKKLKEKKEKDIIHPDNKSSIGINNLIKEVYAYLNEKLGSGYKISAKKNQALVKARHNEGFIFDNFKTVIDTKYSEWSTDPNMMQYLRPETLFGNKFEGYLNQIGIKQEVERPRGREIR